MPKVIQLGSGCHGPRAPVSRHLSKTPDRHSPDLEPLLSVNISLVSQARPISQLGRVSVCLVDWAAPQAGTQLISTPVTPCSSRSQLLPPHREGDPLSLLHEGFFLGKGAGRSVTNRAPACPTHAGVWPSNALHMTGMGWALGWEEGFALP